MHVILLFCALFSVESLATSTLVAFNNDYDTKSTQESLLRASFSSETVQSLVCASDYNIILYAPNRPSLRSDNLYADYKKSLNSLVVDYFDSNSDSTFPERFGCKGEYKSTIVDKSNLESVSLQNNQLLQFDPSVEINDITSLYDKLVGSRVLLLLTSIDYKDIEQSENLSTASLLYTPANNSKLFFGRNKLFSSGIYSGLVVSFVFIVILVVALNCLLGLQTPTRFAKPPKDKKL